MTSVMPGLLPETQGIQFTARPVLRTRESLTSSQGHVKSGLLHSPTLSGLHRQLS